MITLSGLFYFLGLAVAMLYLNMVLLGRRHWAGGEASRGHWLHSLVRFVAVVWPVQLHGDARTSRACAPTPARSSCTRSRASRLDLIKNIPADRPVLIQVYYSPEVPREYVEVKADLLGLLKEYEARSGGKIRLNLVPTELYSTEAREAEKRFGIEPRRVFIRRTGQADVGRGLPGRRLHLGRRGSRDPVLRPRPAGRVRADPVDPGGLAERPQEGRHPDAPTPS